MNYQKTFILGRLTADPQIRELPNGGMVADFSVAVNTPYTDKKGIKQKETEFFKIVVFGKLVDFVSQYIKKSDIIFIEGKLKKRNNNWEIVAEIIQWQNFKLEKNED